MKKELNLANVLISLIMLAVGVILVINSEDMINMMTWFIGIVIKLISIIRIIYLFNDKILNLPEMVSGRFLPLQVCRIL